MPWILNVSKSRVQQGDHPEAQILIQIQDPATEFVTPAYSGFAEIHQFEFLDCDETETTVDEVFWCQPSDATRLVAILTNALEREQNVIVHCHAGVCRSGAVAEVGTMMGFTDTGAHRIPNVLVKRLMIKELGWGYD